jgi:hypothetical protein
MPSQYAGNTLRNVGHEISLGKARTADLADRAVARYVAECAQHDELGHGYHVRLRPAPGDPATTQVGCAVATARATCDDLVAHTLFHCRRSQDFGVMVPDRQAFYAGNNLGIAVVPDGGCAVRVFEQCALDPA